MNEENPRVFRNIVLKENEAFARGAVGRRHVHEPDDGFTCNSLDGQGFEYHLIQKDSQWIVEEVTSYGEMMMIQCSR